MRDFAKDRDRTLIAFWNDREGSLGFITGVEEELNHRGYKTRDPNGESVMISTQIVEDDPGGHEPDDPKSEGYHDRMAAVWDSRPGK